MKIFHARQTDPVYFQLNLTKRVLSRRDGKPMERTLPDQEMRLLCCFAEHPGELLTRDQLQRVGWGARRMATDTVDKAVSEIRAALGDNRTDQLFIQTVRPSRDQPGPRGYRFVAEFESSSPDDEKPEEDENTRRDAGQPISKSDAKEILKSLPEAVRETLEGIFFLINLRDAPGSEDNPRRLLRRFQQILSKSDALPRDVVNQIQDDFQFAIDKYTGSDYGPGHSGYDGYDLTRAMIEPVLEYLPSEEECFRRIGAFGTDVAVSLLTEKYSNDASGHAGGHGECYHAYRMQKRILQHFLDHDYGLAVLPFTAYLLVTESPNPPTSASASIFQLAEGVARKVVGELVRPVELARQYPFVDPQTQEDTPRQSRGGVDQASENGDWQPILAEDIAQCRVDAERGNREALFQLGVCYSIGAHVPKDLREAVSCYRRAAELGHAEAQFKLGLCNYSGKGIESNHQKAAEWYRKAALQGHPSAEFWLGLCYDSPIGLQQDSIQAATWYRKAAEQGHAVAQYKLGYCFSSGHGVDKNLAEGAHWYKLAAVQGNQDAQYALGWCYEHGDGVLDDLSKAVEWYRLAAAQGNPDAKKALAELGADGSHRSERKSSR